MAMVTRQKTLKLQNNVVGLRKHLHLPTLFLINLWKVPANQQQFLANIHNKSRFISMLSDKLITENIAVKQAQNDADVLIIETAIEQFNATNTIVVVGEDVDLLILLTARTPIDKIIYFLKPGRAQQRTEMYSSKSLSAYPKCQNHILFLHAIIGCDTTS